MALLPKTSDGSPNKRHADSVSASHRIGFFPVNNLGRDGGGEEGFFGAVKFIEALVGIADKLFNVLPKDKRTDELRKLLRILEVELLPSNVMYIPIGNQRHRIWRIVAEESIAISTRERVPCIICLEVVMYGEEDEETSRLTSWWKDRRHPQRHNNFLEKGFQVLTNRMNSLSKQLGAGFEQSFVNETPVVFEGDGDDSEDEERGLRSVLETPCETEAPLGTPETAAKISFGSIANDEGELLDRGNFEQSKTSGTNPIGQWSSPVRHSEVVDRKIATCSPPSLKHRTLSESDCDSPTDLVLNKSEGEAARGHEGSAAALGSPIKVDSNAASSSGNAAAASPPIVFKECWKYKEDRIRETSAWGHLPGWKLFPCFIKSNDDLRQEQLASQLIREMAQILSIAKVPVWLCPYSIIAVSDRAGVIEAVSDSISIDSLKRNYPNYTSLSNFFVDHFGLPGSDGHAGAKANFVESMAAYSVVCYLLQVKDRHNGNILLTKLGHIVHIDFGFFFLSSPGKGMGFERAPFKLTREAVEMMDGPGSRTFTRYRDLCVRTFMELRKNAYRIILLVEMLVGGNEDLQCFAGNPDKALMELQDRFKLDMNDVACRIYVDHLIDESLENWRTKWYDRYQRCCTGVLN